MRGAFIKNTDCTDAHGWVFSRILYSCSAAYRLVLMRRRRNGLPRIFRMRKGRCGAKNLWKSAGSVGVKLSAQCAKEQAECIYSPTDRRFSQKPCGLPLSKNTDCTDAHGWVFSRILYSCSAAYRLVLMRRRRNGLPRIFRMRKGRCGAKNLWKSEGSVGDN